MENRPDALHLTAPQLLNGLDHIRQSQANNGVLEMIVIRPCENERFVLHDCLLSAKLGVHGDDWAVKCWKTLPDGSPHPEVQVAIMNSRAVALVAQDRARWPLAGDNLYVDLDLSASNLPPGQQLSIGSALIEITPQPHNGCAKFTTRYGRSAVEFVNSPVGKQLHLRGIYAKVVQDGRITVGDRIEKL